MPLVPLVPLVLLVLLVPLVLDAGWLCNTVDGCTLGVIGCTSRGAVGLGVKAVDLRGLLRNYVTRSNS